MATSGKAHGSKLVFKLDNQAGTLKDISSYVKSVDGLPAEIEMNDVTCGGAVGHQWFRGLPSGDIKIECVFDDTADSAWDVIKDFKSDTTPRSFEYGPAGSTSGYVKITGECVIKSCPLSAKSTDPLTFVINASLDGADVVGVYS